MINQLVFKPANSTKVSNTQHLVCAPIVALLIYTLLLLGRCEATSHTLSDNFLNYSNEQIAQAIFKAENSKKYPYGIKSINTYGNVEYAHKICLNTIRNNKKRFVNQTKYKDFIEFLGSRYCPTTIKSEYNLNKNWVRNVKYYLTKQINYANVNQK